MEQPSITTEAFQDMQAHLEQRLAEQRRLLQVSQRLGSSFDLAETLPDVAETALQMTGAQAAHVVLGDHGVTGVYSAGSTRKALETLDDHLLQTACEAGEIMVPDLAAVASEPAYAPLANHLGAIALWPLGFEGRCQGLLWVGYHEAHDFTEREIEYLTTLAAQTSDAIARARAYREAQRGRQRLEAVLGSTADPIVVVDPEGRLSLLNPAAEELLGIRAADVLKRPMHEVLQDYPRLLRFFENHDGLTEDEEWTSPDGRTYSPSLSRVESQMGEADSYVLIMRDITHFKLLNRNQAEFVRLVSHDLRSPLTYMQGFASMLSMVGEMNERQESFAEKILNGISQMTALVDNIQDAGRWDPETGFYEMSREPCDITNLIRDIVANHQAVADKQGITLSADIAPNVPIVNIDPLMVERGLINLVANAIKYSPDGGTVTVSVEVKDNNIVVCVRDTGLGIAAEHIPQLFHRGGRIVTPAIKKNRIKGSGLGLFIVRSVARRHSGDVWVESTLGEGSSFYFRIPLVGANLVGSARE